MAENKVAAIPINQAIFDNAYVPSQLHVDMTSRYGRGMNGLRFELIETYGSGRDVLDVGCGSGSFLLPMLPKLRSAVGVDFSKTMLDGFRAALGDQHPDNLILMQEDVEHIPMPDECVDFAFSYATLYYMPRLAPVITEIGRLVRPGGHVALEFGNRWSLNTLVSAHHHRRSGWAKPFHYSVPDIRAMLAAAQLEPIEWRCFQIMPMYGYSLRQPFLIPFGFLQWRPILGIKIGRRMLDERISSLPGLRSLAFRQLVIAQKR